MKRRTCFQPDVGETPLESRLVLSHAGVAGVSPSCAVAQLPLHGISLRHLGWRHVNAVITEQFSQFESVYFSAAESAMGGGSSSGGSSSSSSGGSSSGGSSSSSSSLSLSQTTSQLGQQLTQGVNAAISYLPGPTATLQQSQARIDAMLNQLQSVNQAVESQSSSGGGSSGGSSSISFNSSIQSPLLTGADRLMLATSEAVRNDVKSYEVEYHAMMRPR